MRLPDFEHLYDGRARTLVPEPGQPGELFEAFGARVEASIGSEYLPVARMSDGEYRLLFGYQPPSPRLSFAGRTYARARELKLALRHPLTVSAATLPHVSSGTYMKREVRHLREEFARGARHVVEHGYLALHLTYGDRPFQEHYHPALTSWLNENGISLSNTNYVPFYFVYALLSGPRRHAVLRGRRILLIHSARGAKEAAITSTLLDEGAASVEWCKISADRSGFDSPDLSQFAGRVDVAMLGAGLGKYRIFPLAECLGVPVIDAGFMFEVWHDPELGRQRPYCSL